jgi:hypothetical protein
LLLGGGGDEVALGQQNADPEDFAAADLEGGEAGPPRLPAGADAELAGAVGLLGMPRGDCRRGFGVVGGVEGLEDGGAAAVGDGGSVVAGGAEDAIIVGEDEESAVGGGAGGSTEVGDLVEEDVVGDDEDLAGGVAGSDGGGDAGLPVVKRGRRRSMR